MNGRIYDPKLGRFLQADPFVQDAKNSQSLNRYTYVYNNPLSYTDPSGYFSLKSFWKKWLRPIVSIGVVVVGAQFGPLGAFLAGGLAGYISSGNITGALIGAFSAAAFMSIGAQFQATLDAAKQAAYNATFAQTQSIFQAANAALHTTLSVGQQIAKTIAHGLAGGIMQFLSGGKFGHGFASAGLAQAFAGPVGELKSVRGRVAAASLVGGTASAVTGGKFANGAVTAAFGRAFNDEAKHDYRTGTSNSGRVIDVPVSNELVDQWLGVGPEDWISTGSDNLIRAISRGRISTAPDVQYAVEHGMKVQQFEQFDYSVSWWIDENGQFGSTQVGEPVSLGTYWRPPDPASPIRITRTRFRFCVQSVCSD